MNDEVKPALTAEEWAKREARRGELLDRVEVSGYDSIVSVRQDGDATFPTSARHALAALCLYQQPFGFTARHAESLRVLLILLDTLQVPTGQPMLDDIQEVRARIAALLPPPEAVYLGSDFPACDGTVTYGEVQ